MRVHQLNIKGRIEIWRIRINPIFCMSSFDNNNNNTLSNAVISKRQHIWEQQHKNEVERLWHLRSRLMLAHNISIIFCRITRFHMMPSSLLPVASGYRK